MSLAEDRGHAHIRCRICGYVGWSEDTGACPRCPIPSPPMRSFCEGCGTLTRLFLVDINPDGAEEWLCRDCRADWKRALELGMS